jgi:hypothetical protein
MPLTTHIHPVLKLRRSGAILSFPPPPTCLRGMQRDSITITEQTHSQVHLATASVAGFNLDVPSGFYCLHNVQCNLTPQSQSDKRDLKAERYVSRLPISETVNEDRVPKPIARLTPLHYCCASTQGDGGENHPSWIAWPWRRRHYDPLKPVKLSTQRHGVNI